MLVSRKSAFIHLLTREAAPPGAQLAAQLVDHRQGCVRSLLALGVFAQPAAELLVQCRVLGPRSGTCSFDQVFVGAQGDVLHGNLRCTTTVYTNVVLRVTTAGECQIQAWCGLPTGRHQCASICQAYADGRGGAMPTERKVRLFRNGRNQAVRIPRDFELPGSEALLRKEGDRLIVEPMPRPSLLKLLSTWEPLDEDLPPI